MIGRDQRAAAQRSREDAEPGEKVYAVRPLLRDESGTTESRVIPFSDYIGRPRAKMHAQK